MVWRDHLPSSCPSASQSLLESRPRSWFRFLSRSGPGGSSDFSSGCGSVPSSVPVWPQNRFRFDETFHWGMAVDQFNECFSMVFAKSNLSGLTHSTGLIHSQLRPPPTFAESWISSYPGCCVKKNGQFFSKLWLF